MQSLGPKLVILVIIIISLSTQISLSSSSTTKNLTFSGVVNSSISNGYMGLQEPGPNNPFNPTLVDFSSTIEHDRVDFIRISSLGLDMVSGVEHMHKEGIIHRDLKPQNILIRNVNPVRAKIGDLGISKTLAPNTSSLTVPATGSGTFGWEAPETLRGERQTRGVDLFSMGCIIFYSLTLGVHPFGEESDRAVNIRNNNIVNKKQIHHIPEAYQLVCHLLDPVCDARPTTSDVLLHPFFWDSDIRLSFLRDASD